MRPADLSAVRPAATVSEVVECLRATADACTLLANDRGNDEKGRWLRISLVEHCALRCLPMPAPLDAPHDACAWATVATNAERVEILRLAALISRQYSRRADIPQTGRGDAAAATWIFRRGQRAP